MGRQAFWRGYGYALLLGEGIGERGREFVFQLIMLEMLEREIVQHGAESQGCQYISDTRRASVKYQIHPLSAP